MNYSQKITYILQITLVVCALIFAGASVAAAQTLSVDFGAQPLFFDADVKPGDSTDRTVTVTNNGTATEEVFMLAENVYNDGLADVMQLIVTAGSETYFSGNFDSFFTSGGVDLGSLAAGDSITYTFTASLSSATGNEYQLSSFGFDLRVGFRSGESQTDSSGGGSGAGSSAGGSSGSSLPVLLISNETVTLSGSTATITWNTNRPATSYVVCGDLADGPFILSTEFPLYGYQFVIPEQSSLTTQHSRVQAGLAPGEYECRPASREQTSDNFTVGAPVSFVVPDGVVAGAVAPSLTPAPSVQPTPPPGSVLGKGWKGGGLTYEEWRAEVDRERAERERLEQEALDEMEDIIDGDSAAASGLDPTQLPAAVGSAVRENRVVAWGVSLLFLLTLAYFGRRYMRTSAGI